MRLSTFLQVLGGLLEFGGIIAVGLGISETRARFTERPSLLERTRARAKKAFRRVFKRRRPGTAIVGTVRGTVGIPTAKARGQVGFGSWEGVPLEDRVEELRRVVESHATQLGDLYNGLDAEETARHRADEKHERRVDQVDRELRGLVQVAAAGGLGLETVGGFLFAAGVAVQTWGNVLGS